MEKFENALTEKNDHARAEQAKIRFCRVPLPKGPIIHVAS